MSMKQIILILFSFLCMADLSAQQPRVELLRQSADGKNVKLIWFLSGWQKDITGFNVKRKAGNGNWEQLNASPIVPGVTRAKNLSLVESNNTESARLSAKLNDMITAGRVKEISTADYLQRLNTDKDALRAVAFIIALDYDMALINGFGYIDHSTVANTNYTYGLFNAANDKQLATTGWKYGTQPDLDIITNITTRRTSDKNIVQLVWTVDTTAANAVNLAGFNIYSNGKKLNTSHVMSVNNAEKSAFTWFDTLQSATATVTYSVSAVTIFGIEGPKQPYTYDPANIQTEYPGTEVEDLGSDERSGPNAVVVTWKHPVAQERFVKGYVVQYDPMPEGYRNVSDTLPPGTKTYTYRGAITPGSYTKFKVMTIYNDGTVIPGVEKMFYYYPKTPPAKPTGLTAELQKEGKELYVQLRWNKNTDGLTDRYHLYVSNPVNDEFYHEAGIPTIKDTQYRYKLTYEQAKQYRFCVSAVSAYHVEGQLSDTAKVMSPSVRLPFLEIENVSLDSNRVVIRWQYEKIWDLKGYRVFQNGNLVANEYQLAAGVDRFVTPGLKWDAEYSFTIQAVTESGVESRMSLPAKITIYRPVKETK